MPEVQTEYKIGGKTLLFKERIPLKEGHKLKAWLSNRATDDYADDIPALMLMVAPCELVPEPEKREAWDDLDTFGELVPIINAAAEYIVGRIVAATELRKN